MSVNIDTQQLLQKLSDNIQRYNIVFQSIELGKRQQDQKSFVEANYNPVQVPVQQQKIQEDQFTDFTEINKKLSEIQQQIYKRADQHNLLTNKEQLKESLHDEDNERLQRTAQLRAKYISRVQQQSMSPEIYQPERFVGDVSERSFQYDLQQKLQQQNQIQSGSFRQVRDAPEYAFQTQQQEKQKITSIPAASYREVQTQPTQSRPQNSQSMRRVDAGAMQRLTDMSIDQLRGCSTSAIQQPFANSYPGIRNNQTCPSALNSISGSMPVQKQREINLRDSRDQTQFGNQPRLAKQRSVRELSESPSRSHGRVRELTARDGSDYKALERSLRELQLSTSHRAREVKQMGTLVLPPTYEPVYQEVKVDFPVQPLMPAQTRAFGLGKPKPMQPLDQQKSLSTRSVMSSASRRARIQSVQQ